MPSKSILVFFTANHHFQSEREIFHQFFLFISFLWNQKQTLADSLGSRLKAKRSKSFTPSVTSQVISLLSLLFYIRWKKLSVSMFCCIFQEDRTFFGNRVNNFLPFANLPQKKNSTTFFSKKFQKRLFFFLSVKFLDLTTMGDFDHLGKLNVGWLENKYFSCVFLSNQVIKWKLVLIRK